MLYSLSFEKYDLRVTPGFVAGQIQSGNDPLIYNGVIIVVMLSGLVGD